MKKTLRLGLIFGVLLLALGGMLAYLNTLGYLFNPVTNTLSIRNDRGMEAVVSIDRFQAFDGKVVFGKGVTLIHGDWSKAKEVVIENGIQRIGDRVFEKSTADIYIPASIEKIGIDALWNVEGVITTDPQQTHFLSLDGMLIDLDTKTLISISPWVSEIEIPECVEHIGSGACEGKSNLKKVTMPHKVLTISFAAFLYCENLTEVQLSDSLLEIWEEAFYGCPISVLIFPPNVEFKSIDSQGMFYGTRVYVFSGKTTIDDMNFWNPELQYIVFLDTPPDHNYIWEFYAREPGFRIYYLNEKMQYWAPNGETDWHGIPIIGIDSLDDLPALE